MKVMVTGGAGYIGSHFVKCLISNNHKVCVVDNLSRGHRESVPSYAEFVETDLLNADALNQVINAFQPDAVVHFAAFAYVGESVEKPELYYLNNVVGSYNLVRACVENSVKKFVFSSTCSIYGNPVKVPISEEQDSKPINPYANTKLIIETLLNDFEKARGIKSVCLRYFNAAGADPSGEIGESHNPEPHLIPLVIFTAQKKRDKILVFGNDYETTDGTCLRDYTHVNDLADAHLSALNYLADGGDSTIINLGTGNGNSVLDIIEKTKVISGNDITIDIVGRRAGDPAILVADNKKANSILGWKPKYGIEEIIKTAWAWHQNPKY